jgi:sterol desaturase/sphingolipid hydroxylase (fatty acid hydroxylase superfamily)
MNKTINETISDKIKNAIDIFKNIAFLMSIFSVYRFFIERDISKWSSINIFFTLSILVVGVLLAFQIAFYLNKLVGYDEKNKYIQALYFIPVIGIGWFLYFVVIDLIKFPY